MIMKKPEIDVIRFECSDIVAASGGIKTLTWTGVEDTTNNNNYVSFGGNSYLVQNSSSDEFKTMKSDLANYFGDSTLENASNSDIKFGEHNLNIFIGNTTPRVGGDGTYRYDGNKIFTKIS